MLETPFLNATDRWLEDNELAFVLDNLYPVSKGHVLMIPKRVVPAPDDMPDDEMLAVFALMKSQKQRLITELKPDGFTWGWNDGAAAGQTIAHVHLHLIPRYDGDVSKPRGGICNIFESLPEYYS